MSTSGNVNEDRLRRKGKANERTKWSTPKTMGFNEDVTEYAQGSESYYHVDTRRTFDRASKPRNTTRPHRRQVPNLLEGSPLLSAPVTPHFTPSHSPAYLGQLYSNHGNMAIFPTFMLAPSIVAEGSEEFMRQAMENAIGLPPIICQYADAAKEADKLTSSAPRKSKKKVRQKCDWRKGSAEPESIPPRIDSNFDFPLLDNECLSSGSPRMIETPVSNFLSSMDM